MKYYVNGKLHVAFIQTSMNEDSFHKLFRGSVILENHKEVGVESNQLRVYYRDIKMWKELFLLTNFRRDFKLNLVI